MKTSDVKKVKELAHKLRDREITNVRLAINKIEKESERNLTLKHFNSLITDFKERISNFQEEEPESISHSFISRFLIMQIEKTLTEIGEDFNDEIFDPRSKSIFRLKKRMLELEILTYRGLREYSIIELNETIKQLIRLEDYEDAVIALEKKIIYLKIYKTKKEIKKAESQLTHLKLLKSALSDATSIYISSGSIQSTRKSINEINIFYQKSIILLEKHYTSTKSNLVLYYLHMLKYAYYDSLKDNKQAQESLSKIDKLLKRNKKSVFTKNRFHQLLLNKSYLYIKAGDLKTAERMIVKSKSHTDSTYNRIIGEHLLSLIAFYKFDIKSLNSIIDKIDSSILVNLYPNNFLVRHFSLKSAYAFIQQDFETSLKTLKNIDFNKESDDWYIYSKLLQIMLLIEFKKNDSAEYNIDSFRKLIERSRCDHHSDNRLGLIKKILVNINAKDFQFNKLSQKTHEILDQLNNDGRYKWQPITPEIIPFHKWVKYKAEGNKYNFINSITSW